VIYSLLSQSVAFFPSDFMQHPTAKIGEDCLIGPYVSIGPNVVVEDGVRLQRCTLFEGARVKKNTWIENSIIGWEYAISQSAQHTVPRRDVNDIILLSCCFFSSLFSSYSPPTPPPTL